MSKDTGTQTESSSLSGQYPELMRLISIVQKLRDPQEGCPWDLEQNHQSLVPYMLEEAYECVEAIQLNRPLQIQEELGDVLLQVLLHSVIAEQNSAKAFTLETVAKGIADKLVHRHPHVFQKNDSIKILPNQKLNGEQVLRQWEKIKQEEVDNSENFFSIKKYSHLPQLLASEKIGKKSQLFSFDWDNATQVFEKVKEEMLEVKQELDQYPSSAPLLKEEIGDLLFSVTQLARHTNICAEEALFLSNKKFMERFNLMHESLRLKNLKLSELSLDEKEQHWKQAKKDYEQQSK